MTKARRDFTRLRQELRSTGIEAEWRLYDLYEGHDRWIITESACYNVPPVNTLFAGQWSQVTQVGDRPPFEDWWAGAMSILG